MSNEVVKIKRTKDVILDKLYPRNVNVEAPFDE